MATDTNVDKTGTRPRVIDYSYRYREASESVKDHGLDGQPIGRRITSDVVSVILKIIGDTVDGKVTFDGEFEGQLAPLFPNGLLPDPCMAIPTAAYGLKTTLGNAVSSPGIREADASKQIEAIETRYNTIAEDKEWREGREGGPRLIYVVDAYKAYLEAKHGNPFNERQYAALRASVIKKTTTEVLKNPHVRAEYDAAELLRKQATATKSREAAASVVVTTDEDETAILNLQ